MVWMVFSTEWIGFSTVGIFGLTGKNGFGQDLVFSVFIGLG
jgi:hypothetical protein